MRLPRILTTHLRDTFALDWGGTHGASHWARVARIGERLAMESGARLDVVRLFAFFHDARRRDDGYDPGHGHRGADRHRAAPRGHRLGARVEHPDRASVAK